MPSGPTDSNRKPEEEIKRYKKIQNCRNTLAEAQRKTAEEQGQRCLKYGRIGSVEKIEHFVV
jgi:hypothetical protein